jgi:hypothetical protein
MVHGGGHCSGGGGYSGGGGFSSNVYTTNYFSSPDTNGTLDSCFVWQVCLVTCTRLMDNCYWWPWLQYTILEIIQIVFVSCRLMTNVYTTNYFSSPRRNCHCNGNHNDCSCYKPCCLAFTCISLKLKTKLKYMWTLIYFISEKWKKDLLGL